MRELPDFDLLRKGCRCVFWDGKLGLLKLGWWDTPVLWEGPASKGGEPNAAKGLEDRSVARCGKLANGLEGCRMRGCEILEGLIGG